MNNLLSSTAVTRTEDGSIVLATSENIFIEENGKWICTLSLSNYQIRDLTCSGGIIYGAGDNGIFIRSTNGGNDWLVEHFPTKANVWSIVSNGRGLVVAHGEKVIYISTNYGETWSVLSPFGVHNPPSIRSLCLYEKYLFIGTKIHPENGGVWMMDLSSHEITKLNAKTNQMISAMLVTNHQLVTVSGSCRGKDGIIEFISLHDIKRKTEYHWNKCYSTDVQGSYLDISAHNGVLYTTSSQNESGYSTVSRVYLESQQIVPCDYVRGHGWRICNENENYIVAAQNETRFFEKNSQRVC